MQIDILSGVPELLSSSFNHSIIKRAIDANLVKVNVHNLRDYTTDKHKKIDDYPYGGEAGMVLKIEPLVNAIESLQKKCNYDDIIYMSPDGQMFNQSLANELSLKKNLLLICGHYKGIDERVRQHFITREISIGNYVLSGGELAAAVITDAVVRLIPGAIGDAQSALNDSFQNNDIAYPVYTRPAIFRNLKVPDILLSGNHQEIKKWQSQEAEKKTSAFNQKNK